jgi:hypothetical protein
MEERTTKPSARHGVNAMKRPILTTIALLGLIGSAYALNPPLKEGYWSVHMLTVDQPGNKTIDGKYFLCRNHAFDAYTEARQNQPGCVIKSQSTQGNKRSVELSCQLGATTITSKGVATYNSDTSTHSETSATYSPAFNGMTSEKVTMDFAYVGSCPAGIQPGDRVNQNGMVMHLWRH